MTLTKHDLTYVPTCNKALDRQITKLRRWLRDTPHPPVKMEDKALDWIRHLERVSISKDFSDEY